jgi:hypothetical protein
VAVNAKTLRIVRRYPLGTRGRCPDSLAWTEGRLWFSFACGPAGAGIGTLDPRSGRVHLFTKNPTRTTEWNDPLLIAAPNGTLLAGDRGIEPTPLFEFSVGRQTPRLRALVPRGPENLKQFAIWRNHLLVAGGNPYFVMSLRLSRLTEDGNYPTGPYPEAIAASRTVVAAGLHNTDGVQLVLYRAGTTQALRKVDFGDPFSASPFLYPAGLAFGAHGMLYAVSGDTYGQVAVLHVIQT